MVDGVALRRAQRSSSGRTSTAMSTTACSPGARRRSSESTSTTTDDVHLGVTVDDDPAQGLFRETGRYLFFKGDELEAMGPASVRRSQPPAKQILVAGIGNAWMKDDAFGGSSPSGSTARELPAGVSVFDFGTGGLDLAYEVMRGTTR